MNAQHPAIKFISVSLAAFACTCLCFYLMLFLITTDLTSNIEMTNPVQINPSFSTEKTPPEIATRIKPQKALPMQPPPDPAATSFNLATRVELEATRPTFGSMADRIGPVDIQLKLDAPHSDMLPLFVVQPIYPLTAAMREIEGFVLVEFSVRDNGTVANPVVIASEPAVLFDQAALNAVTRFKFKPRKVGGDVVRVDKVQLKFAFQLDSLYDINEETANR